MYRSTGWDMGEVGYTQAVYLIFMMILCINIHRTYGQKQTRWEIFPTYWPVENNARAWVGEWAAGASAFRSLSLFPLFAYIERNAYDLMHSGRKRAQIRVAFVLHSERKRNYLSLPLSVQHHPSAIAHALVHFWYNARTHVQINVYTETDSDIGKLRDGLLWLTIRSAYPEKMYDFLRRYSRLWYPLARFSPSNRPFPPRKGCRMQRAVVHSSGFTQTNAQC